MPKRKAEICGSGSLSITSLDAALDMLACDTFTRLQTITSKFEAAAGIKLNEGVIRNRWDEAVRRYWVMKGMDDLVCTAKKAFSAPEKAEEDGDEVKMEDTNEDSAGDVRRDQGGRLLPDHEHPGAPVVHKLSEEEEQEWRRWTPKTGDPVLVELSDDSIWPGKIIDKKTYFQGRTQPRGNHFFAVRLYCEDMQPTVTIKSRLLPLQMRPNPPLLASTNVLSAFNHATNPATFDLTAQARESLAAHRRTHPGVSGEPDKAKVKAEKTAWNELVNWVMSERRVEKLRALDEERKKRLQAIAQESDFLNGEGEARCMDRVDDCPKKRRMTATVPLPPTDSPKTSRANSPASSFFGPAASASTPKRMASPALASFIRPALSTPQRPHSPRRVGDRRRSVYTGVGEYSPRGRGATYTPPRVLPTGDETAFYASGSPAPSLQTFDFVSPLGPVRLGRLDSEPTYPKLQRKGSLEAVKEEPTETEDGWTVVKGKRGKRAGSLPALEKKDGIESSDLLSAREEMTVDA